MFDLFYFQALAVKESRVREAMGQRNTMRGRESSRAGEEQALAQFGANGEVKV